MQLNRKFPTTANKETTFSRSFLLELNMLLVQAFIPQDLVKKERAILLAFLNLNEDCLSEEGKQKIMKVARLKTLQTLNEYLRRLQKKGAVLYEERVWKVATIYKIPEETTQYNFTVKCQLKKK